MRILTTLLLTLATVLPCFGATTWPAATNAPNTFFQTNRFLKQVTFGTPATNIIADSGSSINGVGFTNNTVYANNFIGLGQVLTNGQTTAVTFNDDLTLGTAASDLIVGGTTMLTNSLTVGTNVYVTPNSTTANIKMQSGNANTLVVTNGSVGIGKLPGAYSLDISGGLNVGSSISAGGGLIGNGDVRAGGNAGHLFYWLGKTAYFSQPSSGTITVVGNMALTNGNETLSGNLTATNGLYYFPQTNGLVYAMTNLTPVHAWGCMMSWGTNLINGGSGTYAPVTNNPSFCTARTNAFGANIAGGVLTNLIAGFYRVAIHLSGVAVDNSAVVEGDLLLNNVVRDEVSFITAFDNPPRIKGMSAFGRLYITNNTPITFQIKSSGANGVTVYRVHKAVCLRKIIQSIRGS